MEKCLKKLVLEAGATGFQNQEKGGWEPVGPSGRKTVPGGLDWRQPGVYSQSPEGQNDNSGYNPSGHEVEMEIPGQEEKGAPLKRNRWPQTLVKIAAALVFFAPFVCSAEYIKAVNYFGKSWPIAFWNSDLSEVSADFRTIQEDGFNAIILIVPWGEFQPGVDPIRFNDEAYRRLSMVCNKAHSAGFKVFLRVSYNADYYPHVQLPNSERANSLITGNSLIPAGVKYLETIDEATRECSNGVFISWEDFSLVIFTATTLETLEERTAYSKHLGYAAWINRNANSDYKPELVFWPSGTREFTPIGLQLSPSSTVLLSGGSERSSQGPESPSSRLPEPAFSDTSPFLGDIGIVFSGAAAA